jgi:hypothetical protein
VLTWSRGSIGVVGSVFEVMTRVDLGLTSVSRLDSADSVISGNDLLNKNLGRHKCKTPIPKQGLQPIVNLTMILL